MQSHEPPMDEIFKDNPEGLVFDCDGTLIDTMPSHLKGWREALDKYGLTMSDGEYYGYAGKGTADIIAELAEKQGKHHVDVEAVAEDKARMTDTHLHNDPMAVIEPTLNVLMEAKRRGLKVGVASGGDTEHVRLVLERCDMMKHVDALVCRDEVPNGKPDPDLFLVCAERLGVDPRKCVGFEDGDLGMQAIRAAGMRAYDVRYWAGYPLPGYLRQTLLGES